MPQQQQNNQNTACSNSKGNAGKNKKCNQLNQNREIFGEGAGDGGALKQKQQQQHSSNQSKRPLHATEEGLNQSSDKDQTNIPSMCMEQLQRQMQSILLCSEINKNQQTSVNGSNLASPCRSRRQSLEQQLESETRPQSDKHQNSENNRPMSKSARLRQKRKAAQRNKYVAIDCEMVGVGHNGQDDMLARVSIVNKHGEVLLDKFVKPWVEVIDYRTSISGIRPENIEDGEDFHVVQDQVVELLQGKILVGHAIRNDLMVLHIKHPFKNMRDTARYKPLCRLVSNGRTPSLKLLSQSILGMEIQIGEHNSVEDARAAMKIYNCLSGDWERYLQKQQRPNK